MKKILIAILISLGFVGVAHAQVGGYYYSAGKIGISTSSPFSTLSVSSTTQTIGTLPLFSVASTTNATILTVLGNGITEMGTSSPLSTKTSTLQLMGPTCVYSNANCGVLQIGTPGNSSGTFSATRGLFFGVDDTTDTVTGQGYIQMYKELSGTGVVGILMLNPNGGGVVLNGHNVSATVSPSNLPVGVVGNSGADSLLQIQNITDGGTFPYTGILFKETSTITGNIWQKSGIFSDVGSDNFGCCYARPQGGIRFLMDLQASNRSVTSNVAGDTQLILKPQGGSGASDFTDVFAGLGTTTPYAKLSVQSYDNSFATAFVVASSTSNSAVGTELFKVNNNGNVGLSTTSPWRTLSVKGTVAISNLSAFATGDSAVCQRSGGEITVDSGISSCIVSTRTAKHDIQKEDSAKALARVLKLQPVIFEYNGTNKPDIGLIAEDVAKIDPRYAQYDPKTLKPKAINWSAITTDMIAVIQADKGVYNTISTTTNSSGGGMDWLGLFGLLGFTPLLIKKKTT